MLGVTDKLILTAGPSITRCEAEYVTDAAQNGWNEHHSDYIRKFEELFARYIGVKYAMATSSCTGALHLALLALGIGPGDEVIIPEITWIATAAAVKYTGANPVFADIDPETWVLDPKSVERLITHKTKVIMPVHLYGHPVEMGPILQMASSKGIYILEDAAPSIGAEYEGKKTGSMGIMSAYSFQGAKALVTGEGGMLLTNDEALVERTRFIGDHGRDPHRTLYNLEIGYKYKISNIQAALGLAQIERVEELVAKKRQIFKWYQERLGDIEAIRLNVERPWARSIFWMSSLILGDSIKLTRDEFMGQLKERKIDTRPFFYPLSSLPMFSSVEVDNPVAYKIAHRGVNLPSGHDRTEEEIDYICAHIRDILGAQSGKTSRTQPQGWLSYRDQVNRTIREYKAADTGEAADHCLPIGQSGNNEGRLRPINYANLAQDELITLLADWRRSAQEWFPTQFNVTTEGTKRWLEQQVLKIDDRLLFLIEDKDNRPIGHVGLYRFNYKERYCELDNVVRGVQGVAPGIIRGACESLIKWAFCTLGCNRIYLRVVSDNERAIRLYERLGFKEIQRVPLLKVQEGDTTRWVEVIAQPYQQIARYFVTMVMERIP